MFGGSSYEYEKTGKVLVLLGASAALIASLVNDKKTKAQGENNN